MTAAAPRGVSIVRWTRTSVGPPRGSAFFCAATGLLESHETHEVTAMNHSFQTSANSQNLNFVNFGDLEIARENSQNSQNLKIHKILVEAGSSWLRRDRGGFCLRRNKAGFFLLDENAKDNCSGVCNFGKFQISVRNWRLPILFYTCASLLSFAISS